MSVEVSVIVPTRQRSDKLRTLLAALARQRLPDGVRLEVVVALDGDTLAADPPSGLDVRVLPIERVGICAAKNRAVAASRGALLVFVNDDVEPEPGFIAAHVAAQRAGHAMVLGASPWKRHADATVLDELIARSRMIFFYDELIDGGDYDFRHAWNLNLSVRREALARLDGPFNEALRPVYFDDVEMAHRLLDERRGVRYCAAARATHDHRYTLRGYFEREALLGVMSTVLYDTSPACYRAIVPHPPRDLVERFGPAAGLDVRDGQRTLAYLASAVEARWQGDIAAIEPLYLLHLPLKRRAFRAGVAAALADPDHPWSDRPSLAAAALAGDPVFAALMPEPATCAAA